MGDMDDKKLKSTDMDDKKGKMYRVHDNNNV